MNRGRGGNHYVLVNALVFPRPPNLPLMMMGMGCGLGRVHGQGACVHSARKAQAEHAHDRKKLGVFATIGNNLACTDHTTPPQCWIASCFTPPPPPKPNKATAHRANGHRVSEVGHVGYDYNGSSGQTIGPRPPPY